MNNTNVGVIKVTLGPMFSGKTWWNITKVEDNRRMRREDGSPVRILMVRPLRDKRFTDENIFSTHDNSLIFDVRKFDNIEVAVLSYGKESENQILFGDFDIIIFDEGQFYSLAILTAIEKLYLMKKKIYFSGLDFTFDDKPFKTTQAVACIPEAKVFKKTNQCAICGRKGSRSARMYENKIVMIGPQVKVGDETNQAGYSYLPICLSCKRGLISKIS